MWTRWADWLENGPPTIFPDGPGVSEAGAEAGAPEASARKLTAAGAAGTKQETKAASTGHSHGHGHGYQSRAARTFKDLLRTLAPHVLDSGAVDGAVDEATGIFSVGHAGTAAASSSTADVKAQAVELAQHILELLEQPVTTPAAAAGAAAPASSRTSWTQQPADQALPDTHPTVLASRLVAVLKGAGRGSLITAVRKRLQQAAAASSPSKAVTDVAVMRALLTLAIRAAAAAEAPAAEADAAAAVGGPIIGTPVAIVASTVPVEYFGSSIASGDFNADGHVDTVFGAFGHTLQLAPSAGVVEDGAALTPTLLAQSGGFYIQYGPSNTSTGGAPTPAPAPAASMLSPLVFARLGWSACSLDFNHDGIADYAVSAPAQGWQWNVSQAPWQADFYYWGAVQIYYGAAGAGLSATPDVVIATTLNETHMGMHLQ